jgi:hypothetical protein
MIARASIFPWGDTDSETPPCGQLSAHGTLPGVSEPGPAAISITLSPGQVEEVVRAAAGGAATVSRLIAGSLASPPTAGAAAAGPATDGAAPAGGWPSDTEDRRLSRSLLRGLSILTRFGPERPERGIVDLATEMGMSPSTAHRYAQTLVELGLLERCARTRKYRLPAEYRLPAG